MRETDNIVDVWKSRTPGWSQFLYPQRDIWGREIDRAGNFWTRLLSPVEYSAAKGDKVDTEMARLGIGVRKRDKELALPENFVKRFETEPKFELEPKQYDNYIKAAGTRARRRVYAYVNSEAYPNISDDKRKEKIEGIITDEYSKERERYVKTKRREIVASKGAK